MSKFTLALGQQISTHVAIAGLFLQSTGNEPLYPIVKTVVKAFEDAINTNCFVIPGNDPHNLDMSDRSDLSTAIGNVYGFACNPLQRKINPRSLAVLDELRKAADLIHHADYCLHT